MIYHIYYRVEKYIETENVYFAPMRYAKPTVRKVSPDSIIRQMIYNTCRPSKPAY